LVGQILNKQIFLYIFMCDLSVNNYDLLEEKLNAGGVRHRVI